ncbi:hypothetical protein OSB04_015948, partial [Centaurea solstitialis]
MYDNYRIICQLLHIITNKQAPRAWYSRIEGYFIAKGFRKCPYEPTLFVKLFDEGCMLIVSVYVDDLIVTGTKESLIEEFKTSMKEEFDMTDLGDMCYFLGVEVIQRETGIYISQRKFAREILTRFNMEQCNPVKNPIVPGIKVLKDYGSAAVDPHLYKQMVGCLMYLAATRPDLMFVISLISRYMERPTEQHMGMIKRVLKGTINLGIFYKRNGSDILTGYSDSDYAGDLDSRKSTSGYAFFLSNAAIAWSSKRQPIVTLSTTEAEFVAAAGHCLSQKNGTIIWCDNVSTIKLSKNPVLHKRSKHIDVRFHFLRDLVNEGTIELVYCSSEEQVADILTKPLKLDAFEYLREKLGMPSAAKAVWSLYSCLAGGNTTVVDLQGGMTCTAVDEM